MGKPAREGTSGPLALTQNNLGLHEDEPRESKSAWLAMKHPAPQNLDQRRASHPSASVPSQNLSKSHLDQQPREATQSGNEYGKRRSTVQGGPTAPLRTEKASTSVQQAPPKRKPEEPAPQRSESQRVLDGIVSMYRCKFKPNASHPSQVLRTLNSAASVIQIHFRYMKQLRKIRNKR